jgi:hypothetical protein
LSGLSYCVEPKNIFSRENLSLPRNVEVPGRDPHNFDRSSTCFAFEAVGFAIDGTEVFAVTKDAIVLLALEDTRVKPPVIRPLLSVVMVVVELGSSLRLFRPVSSSNLISPAFRFPDVASAAVSPRPDSIDAAGAGEGDCTRAGRSGKAGLAKVGEAPPSVLPSWCLSNGRLS